MDYETFRHFSGSWGLVYLVVVFVGAVLFTFRPGAKKQYDEAADIPLKRD
ncbi:MAG TPA: cbb3-type cytochrome c oxidase subunit 3 [Rhizobiales bacterium]|nr:cbb3-type cytochrome c oxidase subunit 3 [Hyphomicrobiales bacterium]